MQGYPDADPGLKTLWTLAASAPIFRFTYEFPTRDRTVSVEPLHSKLVSDICGPPPLHMKPIQRDAIRSSCSLIQRLSDFCELDITCGLVSEHAGEGRWPEVIVVGRIIPIPTPGCGDYVLPKPAYRVVSRQECRSVLSREREEILPALSQ